MKVHLTEQSAEILLEQEEVQTLVKGEVVKCPICKLYKEFISEEARDKFVDDHVRKCIELNRRLRAKEPGAALEVIEHVKASTKITLGEVAQELKGKEVILDEVVYQDEDTGQADQPG